MDAELTIESVIAAVVVFLMLQAAHILESKVRKLQNIGAGIATELFLKTGDHRYNAHSVQRVEMAYRSVHIQ